MHILFLIGNGFDLNIGLNTRYSDFYRVYTLIDSKSKAIRKLKSFISNNIENWSDLEYELGQNTKHFSEKEFTEIYEDITDNLAEYLQSEEDSFDFKKIDSKKINYHLISPDDFLPPADRNRLLEFKKRWREQQWVINMITYNYTQSLEKILKYEGKGINLGNHYGKYPTILQKIEHIHGYVNKRMVLGVNDISQISNKDFHNNQDILIDIIKSKCNQAQKHLVDNWAKEQISRAQIIYIFGSSIGVTDKIWWNLIGEQLKRDFRLVIFSKGKKVPPRRPQRKIIEEARIRNNFLKQTELKDDEKKKVADKIFVATDTDIFDLRI